MFDTLIKTLDNSNSDIRAQAREQLVRMNADVVDALILAMQSGNYRIAWQAAVTLGEIPDSRWVAPMTAAMRSPNILLAQAAVTALENMLQKDATVRFLEALPHTKLVVQMSLVNSLERLQDETAVQPLCRLLESSDNPELIYCIIQALGKLGDSSVIPLIEKFQDHGNHHVRERVTIALDRLAINPHDNLSSDLG